MSAALNFELHIMLALYLDRPGILPFGCEQEMLGFLDFLRRGSEALRGCVCVPWFRLPWILLFCRVLKVHPWISSYTPMIKDTL